MKDVKYKAWDVKEKTWLSIRHLGFGGEDWLWYVQAMDDNEQDIDPPYFPGSEEKEIELVQYVGHTDDNAVELYEGDVVEVRMHNVKRFVIRFLQGSFVFASDYDGTCSYNPMHVYLESDCEITRLGSFLEQPELMEGAKG